MYCYVEIVDGKIQNKGRKTKKVLGKNEIEVSEEIYEQILYRPAEFTTDENEEIISIINGPKPTPKIITEHADSEKVALFEAIIAQDKEIEELKLRISQLEGGTGSGT